MNLYEISSQIENFEFKFDDETGEVLNMNELDELKMAKDEKIENIGLFIKNLKADEKALDDEIKALQARKKAKTNKIGNLSSYLESVLNGSKFERDRVVISFRKSSSVVIDDEQGFIDMFGETEMVSQKVLKSINKKEVKAYLKDNVSSLAHIEEKQNIQIK